MTETAPGMLDHLHPEVWCPMQTTTVPMPDGTLMQVAWRATNPDDPDTETASIVAPNGKDHNDHNAHPGVYDHVHHYLVFGSDEDRATEGYRSPARRALGPSTDEMRKLWDVVGSHRDKFQLTCPESIFQMDGPQIAAAGIFADCVAVVGYGTYDEDTDNYVSPGA